jgi:hypothetical protein
MTDLEIIALIVLPTCTLLLGVYTQRLLNAREDKRIENEKKINSANTNLADASAAEIIVKAARAQLIEDDRRIKELEAKVAHLETVVAAMGGQFLVTNTIILDKDHPRVISADVKFVPDGDTIP